jgi:hypothetical protein
MNTFTDLRLLEVAQHQRRILWVLLVSIPVVISTFALPATSISTALILAAFLLIGIIATVLIYRLARSLEVEWPWLYVVCAFIPYLNTLTLLIINLRATAALKRRGIRVGLLGAKQVDLATLVPVAQQGAAPNGSPAAGSGDH